MAHENPKEFEVSKIQRVSSYKDNENFLQLADDFFFEACKQKYSYDFTWLGLPVIQFPEDLISLQEIIFNVQPDVIIETGIARGGSLIFYASLLKLLGKRKVIGIDINILDFNRLNIENHFLSEMVELMLGDSTTEETFNQLKGKIKPEDKIMICLDSNHSEAHVYSELKQFADLVSIGSYLVVFDTTVETLPSDQFIELEKYYNIKDWGKGNNPGSAVTRFLLEDKRFAFDKYYEDKSLISNCRGGFLKRVI